MLLYALMVLDQPAPFSQADGLTDYGSVDDDTAAVPLPLNALPMPYEASGDTDRDPIDVSEKEVRLTHEFEEASIRLTPNEGRIGLEKLVKRVMNKRGKVSFRTAGSLMDDAVWCSNKQIKQAELGTATVPRVAAGDRNPASALKDQTDLAGRIKKGEVLGDWKPRIPGEIVFKSV